MEQVNNNRGVALLDVLIAVLILGMMIPAVIGFIKMGNENIAEKAAAGQAQDVMKAAKEYVLDNYQALTASATAANSTQIPIATLTGGNYLPSTFNAVNPWGQTYRVYVLEPSVDDLLALVISYGGKAFDPANPEFGTLIVPKAAAMIGAAGGYVPSGILASEPNTQIQGAFGGWSFQFAGTDVPNPGAAHLCCHAYFNDGTTTEDFLYRVQVPGRPEFNQMQTQLDMNGNTITMGDADVGGGDTEGIARLNFEDHELSDFPCAAGDDTGGTVYYDRSEGLYICRNGTAHLIADTRNTANFKDALIAAHGSTIPKPTCPLTGATTPQIYLAPAMFSQNDVFKPLKAVQTWAVDNGGSWTVNMRIQTRDGWMFPNSTYGRILVLTKCS